MSVYVLDDGRILQDISEIPEGTEYIVVDKYPETKYVDGKVGVVVGIENGEVKYEFHEPIIHKPESTEPEPTDEELYQAETLLMQTEMLAVQKEQDEVLAAILLNQMEV